MNYPRETYTGEYGPYDYLIIPKAEYNRKLVAEVHDLPLLFSEWSQFYSTRFNRINLVEEWNTNAKDAPKFINLPIITEKECRDMGL